MSKYFAGIEPLDKGYDIISIKPNFGNLTKINCSVTTIKGDIKLDTKKESGKVFMDIVVPTRTRVAVIKTSKNPKITISENVVYKDGKFNKNELAEYDTEDENYVYFYVNGGNYNIVTE